MRHPPLSFAVLLVVLIGCTAPRAGAQTPPAAGSAVRSDSPRIAYVNVQAVASQSVLGQQFKARVEDLTNKKGSPAAIAKLQGDLQAEFQEKLLAILKQLGKERDLQLIFSAVDAGIAWADETVPDLSYEAIRRMDAADTAAPTVSEPEAIKQEIERIRGGEHAAMPAPQVEAGKTAGDPTMTIENGTPYTLTVMLSGPTARRLTLPPGATETVTLTAGEYDKAATVSDKTVIPFYGKQTVTGGTKYSSRFYVKVP